MKQVSQCDFSDTTTTRPPPLYLDSDSEKSQNPRPIIGRMAEEVAFTLYPQGHKRLKACPRD
jgi:hypothetical protein